MPIRDNLVSGPLKQASILYKNQSYIADRVFPIVDKCPPRALISVYDKGAWFRDEAAPRAPGTRARRGNHTLGSIPINTVEYAFAHPVPDEDYRASKLPTAPPVNVAQEAVEFATDKVDLSKERRVAEVVTTSTWSGQAGGVDKAGAWAAGDENTFLSDIETAKELIRSASGFRPNCLVLCPHTLAALKTEATIKDAIKYSQKAIVTADLLASLLDLDEVLIGEAIWSDEGEKVDGSDFASKDVWAVNQGKGMAFLFFRPVKASLKKPAAGIQARTEYENGQPRRIASWREEAEHQYVYEAAEETHILQTGPDMGYLWYDTIET